MEKRTSQPLTLYFLIRTSELLGALIYVQLLPMWMPLTWFLLMAATDTWGAWRVTRPDFKTLAPERRKSIYRQCVWQSTAAVGSSAYLLYVPGNYAAHALLGTFLMCSAVIVAMWGVRDVQRTAVAVALILLPSGIRMIAEGVVVGHWGIPLLAAAGLGLGVMIVYTTKLYADRLAKELALRERAERASEAMAQVSLSKSRFFAAVSHDLRQPVHAIGLYLDPLVRALATHQDPSVHRAIDGIRHSWRALDDLLSQVLDLTRLDAGTMEACNEPVDLAMVIRSLVLQHSVSAERAGVRIIALVKPDQWVWADELMLKRILSNLLDNAIKYSVHGQKVVVAVRWAADQWRIQVRDAGPGIPEAAQASIFEEFVQVGNDARDRQHGYGLGLAIARRFAGLMGGSLHVRSRPGHGCCMSLSLRGVPVPVAKPATASRGLLGLESGDSVVSIEPIPSLGFTSVLFVEDDPLVADAMIQLLEGWGLQVRHVETAAEAMVQSSFGEVAICDVRLPNGASGVELGGMLRNTGKQVILISGETGAEVAAAAAASNLALLSKPVSAEKLSQALQALDRDVASV
jgi:two-component system, sensor histidine kinase